VAGHFHAQAVVVGGGPVGMLTAAELARYGVSTLVLESRERVSERPKANTLHARTVQCLVRRGYLPPPGHSAGPVTGAFHFAGQPGLPITAPCNEPAPVLKRPQAELERLFEERARAAGVRVLRGHRVLEVRQEPDLVRVSAAGPDGPVTCTADYLVGADGVRSLVREQGGIGSEVHPATATALAGSVRLADPDALRPGWHPTARGWIVATALPDGSRYLRTLSAERGPSPSRLPPTVEELSAEASWIAGREIAMGEPRWLSRFSDFSRLALTFRSGRILLAGDAAHTQFPIGGQGLGTGLLDAVNLGWKLALTVRGQAGAGLLDSYDLERRPAARRVVDNTRAQLALMRPDPALDPVRALFADLMAAAAEGGYLGGLISAQDTVLAARTADPSPWEGRFLSNLGLATAEGATDVVRLLAQGRPLLLLLGEPGERYREQARGWAEILHVVRAAPVPDLPCEALLVRPDGYIAWAPGAGGLPQALAAYFGGCAGPGAPEGALARTLS
jgi:2-polyprenyl-6-methoxyphenol hydroxylase-like FAD-dependent oxidoreductase